MTEKISAWKCSICETAYFKEDDAKMCESIHAAYENLEVHEIRKWREDERFPTELLIGDKSFSGVLALYKLDHSSSCEDFYQDEIDE